MTWSNPMLGRVTSGWGPRTAPLPGGSTFHRGVDIAAPRGTAVRSVAAGTVVRSAYHEIRGWHVLVSHGSGISSLYQHLQERGSPAGRRVASGETVGRCGSSGSSTGAHLHLEIHRDGIPIDPAPFLAARGVDPLGKDPNVLTPEDKAWIKDAATNGARTALHALAHETAHRTSQTGRDIQDDLSRLHAVLNPAAELGDGIAAALAPTIAAAVTRELAAQLSAAIAAELSTRLES